MRESEIIASGIRPSPSLEDLRTEDVEDLEQPGGPSAHHYALLVRVPVWFMVHGTVLVPGWPMNIH
eukprot:scaffold137923_cov18-Prasinocladus_malaysianus.AAC.1